MFDTLLVLFLVMVIEEMLIDFTAGQYGNMSPLGEMKEDADGLQHCFEDVSLHTCIGILVALLVPLLFQIRISVSSISHLCVLLYYNKWGKSVIYSLHEGYKGIYDLWIIAVGHRLKSDQHGLMAA
jgi:hypothetical protein